MQYVKIATGEILEFYEIQMLFPKVSFSATGLNAEFMAANGFANLDGDDLPMLAPNQQAIPTKTAHLVGEQWLRIFTIETAHVPENPPPPPTSTIISSPNGTAFAITVTDEGKVEAQPVSEIPA